jgi:hypothetical protein
MKNAYNTLGVEDPNNIKRLLKTEGMRMWAKFIWLRIESSDDLL